MIKTEPVKPVAAVAPAKPDFGVPKPKDTVAVVQISLESEFKATASDVYMSLVDTQRVSVWTGERAEIVAEAGKPFRLMGGHISGEIVELVPNKRIVQKWRLKQWPEGMHDWS